MRLCHLLLFFSAAASGAQPSWPITYSYSPDSLPVIEVRLAPPRKPLPEVAALLGGLESKRQHFETEEMLQVEAAYNSALAEAANSLAALVDRIMHVFAKPEAWISTQPHAGDARGAAKLSTSSPSRLKHKGLSFHESRGTSAGHEMTARINLLPMAGPNEVLQPRIEALERKRSNEERALYVEAKDEMTKLTKIVETEAEAEITKLVNVFVHAQKYGLGASPGGLMEGTQFLALGQPVVSSGLQLTTNVRVMASDEPFPTVASMVEDVERKRDAGEGLQRTRLLELELQLLQAENEILSDRLRGWVEHILQTSA